jgi:hypothetical protein
MEIMALGILSLKVKIIKSYKSEFFQKRIKNSYKPFRKFIYVFTLGEATYANEESQISSLPTYQ